MIEENNGTNGSNGSHGICFWKLRAFFLPNRVTWKALSHSASCLENQ
jgi:hypothetical protein